ncbi:unnamed protein product [Effrenium voratum]|nr:unnamed protein product [Effrenium voratum]
MPTAVCTSTALRHVRPLRVRLHESYNALTLSNANASPPRVRGQQRMCEAARALHSNARLAMRQGGCRWGRADGVKIITNQCVWDATGNTLPASAFCQEIHYILLLPAERAWQHTQALPDAEAPNEMACAKSAVYLGRCRLTRPMPRNVSNAPVANPVTALRPQSASLEAAHHRQREQLRHRKESVEHKHSCGPSQLRLRLRISRSCNWQSHCRSSHALAPEPTPNMPKQFNIAQNLSLVFRNESFQRCPHVPSESRRTNSLARGRKGLR